tara:strand:+ start:1165 stop:1335 length:171 start_codon:yes stop_codon:yes gene_type:complete
VSREGIEKKIESVLRIMKNLRLQYSDCQDQLSDLYSDLAALEGKEKNASEEEEGKD